MSNVIQSIVDASVSNGGKQPFKQFEFGGDRENELVFFFKPECFLSNDANLINKLVAMVNRSFEEHKVEICGGLLLGGKQLDELGIMDRHYGFINKLSRRASKIVEPEGLVKLSDVIGDRGFLNYRILGGHEFLAQFHEFDEKSLDRFWATKQSIKVRSGFYLQKYELNGENMLLVNGFHPLQLSHFTQPTHKIAVLLLRSNTDWRVLKNDMVGNTFPEKASPGSIRGELFHNSRAYGLPSVSIANNCVHLSAGPFEALFEMNNFFKSLPVVKFSLDQARLFHLMTNRHLTLNQIEDSISNPVVESDGERKDLFTLTEDTNSSVAVEKYARHLTTT